MLALPILLGVAFSRFVPSQLVLAGAAVSAYLASATLQAWLRARRRPSYVPSVVVYGAATVLLVLALLVLEPRLVVATVVLVPAGVVTLIASRPGRPRELPVSLAHVAQASVLAPAAMLLGAETSTWALAAATAIAAAEMTGSVLVVRSVIRERDNGRFAVVSVGYHVVITLIAAAALPLPYAAVGALLTARAAGLPVVRRRLAADHRGLRPAQIGMVEAVASTALVLVALAVPLTPGLP